MQIKKLTGLFAWMMVWSGAAAQTPEQIEQLRQNPALVRQLIQQSGLTNTQIRQQLELRGYDPRILDRFLQEGAQTNPGDDALRALGDLGLGGLTADGLEPIQSLVGETPGFPRRAGGGLPVFGLDVFAHTTQFQPVLNGPVPPDYRLGPGDVLVLVLTGDVQLVHELPVARDGSILIPDVGQLFVHRLTLEELNLALRDQLARRYARIRTGQTRYTVGVSKIRVNQIYVLGEITQPGAYQLASVATALNALYAGGGPSEQGDLRDIQVRRSDSIVARLDLYDYLLRGSTGNDVVLEQGDVVFVPLGRNRVSIDGAVRRRAIFGIRPGETLADAIEIAGGFRSDALTSRIAVHRILQTGTLQPGPIRRLAIDVAMERRIEADGSPRIVVPALGLEDGDSIVVDSLPGLNRTLTVGIAGMIAKPGRYAWRDGMTLRDLMLLSRGPTVGASLTEAELARLPADRSQGTLAEIIRVPLDSSYLMQRDADGNYLGAAGETFAPAGTAPDVALEPFDQVTILKQAEFELQRTVSIQGEVRYPGQYALTKKDERISELLERAGGLLETSHTDGARFFRELDNAGRINLRLTDALASRGSSADLILQPGDSIQIPEYTPTVRIEGAVNAPASVLYTENADLDYYIGNAGGYTRDADRGRVSVRYANGSADVRRRKMLFFSSSPRPRAGSTIVVPSKPQGAPLNFLQVLGVTAQIMGSAVAIIAVARR